MASRLQRSSAEPRPSTSTGGDAQGMMSPTWPPGSRSSSGCRRYDRRWLRGDVAAGIAVTALIVPKDLGYAGIAGVPLQNGLYAAAAGAIIYALFGTSRQISTGPSSSLAAVAGGAVVVAGLAGDQAAELVAAIAIVTGLLFLALALLRMGWISRLPLEGRDHGVPGGRRRRRGDRRAPQAHGNRRRGRQRMARARLPGSARSATCTGRPSSSASLGWALILGLRFLAPAVPGALVLVVAGILASHLLELGAHGVALVGDVPRGLPAPELPDLELVGDHIATVVDRARSRWC